METQVMNNGVEAVNIFIKRTEEGVNLTVKAEPRIEEFFKKWGGGAKMAPEQGRLWRRSKADPTPIQVWSYAHNQGREYTEDDRYTVDSTGRELIIDGSIVNLSFLRLVGITEGVSINFDMIMSKQELVNVSQRLLRATDQFYQEYIQTVGMRILVSVQEER